MELAAILVFTLLETQTGLPVTLEVMADRLARQDVVFLGEEHDNPTGHQLQLRVFEALHQRRPDLVLSLEMFERDVQGLLDDYLAGRIDEVTMLAHARPWPDYRQSYRPLVEFARERGLPVIAANTPRPLASRVSQHGVSELRGELGAARSTRAPRDDYFRAFRKVMQGTPGHSFDEASLEKFYASQCLKDDTMAESIADYLAQHPTRAPLVVHLCGKFHSDRGLGTVQRLLERRPLAQVSVVSMEAVAAPQERPSTPTDRETAHFLMLVPKVEEPSAAAEKPTDAPVPAADAVAVDGRPMPSPSPTRVDETPFEFDPAGRPALGIMPEYGATEPGVTIGSVTEGAAASRADLRAKDRIVMLDGRSLSTMEDYMDAMADLKPGDRVRVRIVRGDQTLDVSVRLGSR